MALDDRYANKFDPLDSTAIYPKSGHAFLFSTFDGWKEMTYKSYLCLRIPFHLLKCWCHTSTNLHRAFWSSSWVNTWLDLLWIIWSTSYHHVTLLVHRSQLNLLFTIALVHLCQVFAQASPPHAVCHFKASNLPFTLVDGPSMQSLVSIFSIYLQDYMSCLVCNEFLHHTIWA